MKSVRPDAIRDVLLLSFAAGSADAAGFIGLGRVFTSNMTGNVVLLGIAIGQGHFADAVRSLFVLLVFVSGVALGVRMDKDVAPADWRALARRLLLLEKILLLLFALGWSLLPHDTGVTAYALLGLLAVAMGLQTAAFTRLGAPGVGTTAITSTISAFTTGAVSLTLPGPDQVSGSRLGFQAGVIMLYCLGAAVSGVLIVFLPWLAGWIPIAAAIWAGIGSRSV